GRARHQPPPAHDERAARRCGHRHPDAGAGARSGARSAGGPLRGPADPGGGVSMSEIIRSSATAQARALAAGETGSEELTRAHLDRIGAIDGDLNAFLHVSEDDALATARDVDNRRAAGEPLHPLAGAPIAVKHIVVTAGR